MQKSIGRWIEKGDEEAYYNIVGQNWQCRFIEKEVSIKDVSEGGGLGCPGDPDPLRNVLNILKLIIYFVTKLKITVFVSTSRVLVVRSGTAGGGRPDIQFLTCHLAIGRTALCVATAAGYRIVIRVQDAMFDVIIVVTISVDVENTTPMAYSVPKRHGRHSTISAPVGGGGRVLKIG